MQILTDYNLAQLVADILKSQTVVFPTETSYGLGCDATNQAAVDKIFKIKGRPEDKPLLVVVPSVAMAQEYLVWNELLEKIAQQYWPGPVTVVGKAITPSPPQRRGQGEVSSTQAHRLFSFERKAGDIEKLPLRRQLRQDATKAEKNLWVHLRSKRLGALKFKRQHSIGPYVVDFFHAESKTVIEIDGDIHFVNDENLSKDKIRQQWLEKNGYKILRYNNVEIFENLEWVLEEMYQALTRPLPNPPLCGGEGSQLARGVVAKDNTLAVRVTAHPLLKSITEKLGRPLVATSANMTDAGEVHDSKEIIAVFKNSKFQPDTVLDYGVLPKRSPTTVVSVIGGKIQVLRQGEVVISH